MATNILVLPLAKLTVTTGTNEDWIDTVQFLEDDGVTPTSLAGISFAMEVRAHVGDAEVLITGSSEDGRLSYGGAGNSFLTISVPVSAMDGVPPGGYVADVVATADGYTRVILQLDPITVFEGVTRN